MVACTVLGFVGCGIANRETFKQQSTLKQNFSIGPLIEAHQDLLMEGPRALSGMEVGPPEPFTQSHEYMTIEIDSNSTIALMESLRSDITKAINASGATIVGSSSSDFQANPIAYFSFDYREGSFYGMINVWGLRGEGTAFTIISQITESKAENER
jgi:hypothetical protein